MSLGRTFRLPKRRPAAPKGLGEGRFSGIAEVWAIFGVVPGLAADAVFFRLNKNFCSSCVTAAVMIEKEGAQKIKLREAPST